MQFKFGKYTGWDVRDVPTDYLRWAIENIDLWPKLRAAVLVELNERQSDHSYARNPSPDISVLLEIVQSGRRTLALKYHPDRGGDVYRMQRINSAADFLESHLKTSIGVC